MNRKLIKEEVCEDCNLCPDGNCVIRNKEALKIYEKLEEDYFRGELSVTEESFSDYLKGCPPAYKDELIVLFRLHRMMIPAFAPIIKEIKSIHGLAKTIELEKFQKAISMLPLKEQEELQKITDREELKRFLVIRMLLKTVKSLLSIIKKEFPDEFEEMFWPQ